MKNLIMQFPPSSFYFLPFSISPKSRNTLGTSRLDGYIPFSTFNVNINPYLGISKNKKVNIKLRCCLSTIPLRHKCMFLHKA